VVGGQDAACKDEREHDDGQVDEEDPAPRDRVDEQSADDRAEDRAEQHRHADHGHHATDPARAGDLRQHARPDGHDHPAARALEDTGRRSATPPPREAAERGPEAEQPDGDHVDPLRAPNRSDIQLVSGMTTASASR
jgi:hypothetical protein